MNHGVYPPELAQIENPATRVPADISWSRRASSHPSDAMAVSCQTRDKGGADQASGAGDHQVKA